MTVFRILPVSAFLVHAVRMTYYLGAMARKIDEGEAP
jgi:hypothetical protein